MCYVTLRGLVYFGASIHVYHGVQMLVNMYYELFANSSSREGGVTQVDVIFNCFFFVLGLLLFRGVEQESKGFIKWPTIGFTLLLASRFIIEIIKQIQREREGVAPHKLKLSMSPFSYSSMSVDVDPLVSAAVGIYIFILFVYNHSLEFGHPEPPPPGATPLTSPLLPFHHHSPLSGGGSDCGGGRSTDASSDTLHLIPSSPRGGDSNNNAQPTSLLHNNLLNGAGGMGGGGNLLISHPISTIPNPLFELDSRTRGRLAPNFPQAPVTEYKIDAV